MDCTYIPPIILSDCREIPPKKVTVYIDSDMNVLDENKNVIGRAKIGLDNKVTIKYDPH